MNLFYFFPCFAGYNIKEIKESYLCSEGREEEERNRLCTEWLLFYSRDGIILKEIDKSVLSKEGRWYCGTGELF